MELLRPNSKKHLASSGATQATQLAPEKGGPNDDPIAPLLRRTTAAAVPTKSSKSSRVAPETRSPTSPSALVVMAVPSCLVPAPNSIMSWTASVALAGPEVELEFYQPVITWGIRPREVPERVIDARSSWGRNARALLIRRIGGGKADPVPVRAWYARLPQ